MKKIVLISGLALFFAITYSLVYIGGFLTCKYSIEENKKNLNSLSASLNKNAETEKDQLSKKIEGVIEKINGNELVVKVPGSGNYKVSVANETKIISYNIVTSKQTQEKFSKIQVGQNIIFFTKVNPMEVDAYSVVIVE